MISYLRLYLYNFCLQFIYSLIKIDELIVLCPLFFTIIAVILYNYHYQYINGATPADLNSFITSALIILLERQQPIINSRSIYRIQSFLSQFIKIRMNLKTIKQSKPIAPEIKILDRKTDNYGRTMYQICWISDKNKITWEYIINLKNFYPLITQFQKKYEERIVNWSNQDNKASKSLQQTKGRAPWQSIELEPKQENKNGKMVEISSQNQSQQQNQRVQQVIQSKKSAGQQQDFETTDKPHMLEQNVKDKVQEDNAQNVQNNSNTVQQDQNLQLARLLKELSPHANRKRNPTQIRRRQINYQEQQPKIISIMQVYALDKVWYARVLCEGDVELEVLRDQLRITNPQMLLVYYEKLYQNKMKDFSTKI